jgi:hypothetical protein
VREAFSGKARPKRGQGLPVHHPVRYHALHQPTITKTRSRQKRPPASLQV